MAQAVQNVKTTNKQGEIMAVMMKQLLDRFASMEKAAQATLAAEPGALVGVDSLPGSEHDAKVPADAKKPDAEVAQGQPAGATTAEGAVNGGDAKPLNERKLEVDQTLENPQQKPEITDDALTAKEAEAHLGKLVGDLLADIHAGKTQAQKQAQDASAQAAETKTEPKTEVKDGGEKTATAKTEVSKIVLNEEMLCKLAAAVASFTAGRKAADDAIKQAQAAGAEKQAAVQSRAIAMVKAACIKAAQEAGLNPADAEAAAANAMATAGVPAEAIASAPVATDAGAAPAVDDAGAAGDVQLPDDVTEEELGEAIVDLVSSGELDAETAKALVDEIAGSDAGAGDAGAGMINEDQAAEIIANGLESGEITPEQAQVIAAAIEGGAAGDAGADAGAAAADADAAAAGAADAAVAAQDASDEAQGAADAEAAIKQAAAAIRANTIQKVASHIVAKREQDSQQSESPILQKVASILTARKETIEKENAEKQAQATVTPEQQKYLEGFCKKASELGLDPQMLAQYMIAIQSAQAK